MDARVLHDGTSLLSKSDAFFRASRKYFNTVFKNEDADKALLQDLHSFADGLSSSSMKGPMHWHKRTFIRCNEDLENLMEVITTTDFGDNERITKLRGRVISFWQSANSLKLLEPFADQRQPLVVEQPLPDSSNISQEGGSEVYMEWCLRSLWIRHLHLPGVYAASYRRHMSISYLSFCSRVVCIAP